jgi:hypothetical protein
MLSSAPLGLGNYHILRFVDALQAMEVMPERDRGLTHLIRRGHIPDFAWKWIHAAMELLAAEFCSPAN